MLRARDVRFSRGDAPVLEGFSLEVPAGGVTCLMGENGCGKSTFLDCVLGENVPESGEVLLSGRDAVRMAAPERARLVAYVPQIHENTFPYSVEHMVLMGLAARERGLSQVDESDRCLARAALGECGIAHLAERACTQLSGGEMQMVLLARALVQSAPLLVLDEPTAHLDFKNELAFLQTLERLVLHQGVTVLMATHSPNQAFHLESAGVRVQVAVMAQGKCALSGPPEKVLVPQVFRECFRVEAAVSDVSGAPRQVIPLSVLDDDCDWSKE